jgi:hypothetical protein
LPCSNAPTRDGTSVRLPNSPSSLGTTKNTPCGSACCQPVDSLRVSIARIVASAARPEAIFCSLVIASAAAPITRRGCRSPGGAGRWPPRQRNIFPAGVSQCPVAPERSSCRLDALDRFLGRHHDERDQHTAP